MIHCDHQLLAHFVRLLFGVGQGVYGGFIGAFSHGKQLPAVAGNEVDEG